MLDGFAPIIFVVSLEIRKFNRLMQQTVPFRVGTKHERGKSRNLLPSFKARKGVSNDEAI